MGFKAKCPTCLSTGTSVEQRNISVPGREDWLWEAAGSDLSGRGESDGNLRGVAHGPFPAPESLDLGRTPPPWVSVSPAVSLRAECLPSSPTPEVLC